MRTAGPLLLIGILALISRAAQRRADEHARAGAEEGRRRAKGAADQCEGAIFLLLFIVYPSTYRRRGSNPAVAFPALFPQRLIARRARPCRDRCQRIFDTFVCDELDNGQRYLAADYATHCESPAHLWMQWCARRAPCRPPP